ncbi:MAG: hypothetical protein R3330_15820, partial [Saprospiraceae bacterium]|nr:hypothetical protein [Saprospiraceae bacterium]
GTTEAGVLEFNGLNFWMSNKRPGTIHFRTQEISRLSITNSGNVGIGNFAPEDLLHVKNGDIRVEHTSVPRIKLFQGATEAAAYRVDGSDLWLDNYLVGDTYFSTQNLARLTLAYGGNIGIGTTAPADLLHVQDGNIRLQGDNSFIDLHSTHPSLPTGIRFYEGAGFRGAMFYSVFTNQLNMTNSIADDGLVMDFNNNHVGIGTSAPAQLLHVDGKITIGTDTTAAVAGSMRYDGGIFEGYDGTQWTEFGGGDSHWSQISNRIYYNDGAVLVGRTNTIGSERFGVRYPVASAAYGGMYIETNGHSDSKPFYGYAIDNLGKMWHYYDGASGDWRVNNGGDRLTVENTGDVGVGTTQPDAPLHVAGGNNWDLTSTEGDFKIGNATHRLLMGLATGGVGAGTARIYSKGGASKLILGGDATDVLSI